MSSVLQRLRIQSRTRTKPKYHTKLLKGLVFKSRHLKRHHHLAAKLTLRRKRKSKHNRCQKVLRGKKYNDDKRVDEFVHWCSCVGLELHPHLYIGHQGSCHMIGVVATEDISEGECLAVIPRKCLLSCSNSTVSKLVKKDGDLQNITSSWVPLLIALAAEYSLKSCSYWHPYLSLVPNNENCGPPMVWSESDRERLLEGTGVNKLVDEDMEKMEHDFTSTVLPFMKRHPEIFRNELHSYQVYKKLVSLVMSYSFTDAGDDRLTSSTMMVPFVDLLNHHSNHHAELNFHRKCLKLMAIRDIRKGEEVMNTYGSLSNATLLHTHGFCEVNNPHDTALIAVDSIHVQYLNCSMDKDTLSLSERQKRWKKIKSDNLLEDDYCVDSDGDPEQDLLYLVKLLHIKESQYERFVTKLLEDEPEDMVVELLNKEELSFVTRLAEHCLSLFPESYDSLVDLTDNKLSKTRMSEKEKYALYLCLGQQQCLTALCEKNEIHLDLVVMAINIDSEQQRVFIMRHGERLDSQDRNWKRTAARPYDTPLTARGHGEAHRLVKLRLSRKGVEIVFSSPFLRCLQTAHQACLALDIPGVHTYNLLSEVITKENGMKEQPVVPYMDDTTELSILSFDSSPLPNYPEKLSDAHERYFSALNALADEHWPKTLLLVSHEICVRQAVSWGGSKDDVEASYCGQVELTRKQHGTYDWKLEGYDRVYKYDVPF